LRFAICDPEGHVFAAEGLFLAHDFPFYCGSRDEKRAGNFTLAIDTNNPHHRENSLSCVSSNQKKEEKHVCWNDIACTLANFAGAAIDRTLCYPEQGHGNSRAACGNPDFDRPIVAVFKQRIMLQHGHKEPG
jgi:hypothetical protein